MMELQRTQKVIDDYPEILNAKNIAEYLGIGYVKALKLLKYSDLPCIRIGNTFKIHKGTFMAWLSGPDKKTLLSSEQ